MRFLYFIVFVPFFFSACSDRTSATMTEAKNVAGQWAETRGVFTPGDSRFVFDISDKPDVWENNTFFVIQYPSIQLNVRYEIPDWGLDIVVSKRDSKIVYIGGACAEFFDDQFPRTLTQQQHEMYFSDLVSIEKSIDSLRPNKFYEKE